MPAVVWFPQDSGVWEGGGTGRSSLHPSADPSVSGQALPRKPSWVNPFPATPFLSVLGVTSRLSPSCVEA